MTPEDILTRAGDQLGIRRVFGEPIDRDGVPPSSRSPLRSAAEGEATLPKTRAAAEASAAMVRGIGAYSIRNGQVRSVPAVDTTALAALFVLAVGVVLRAKRRGA